MMTATLPEIRGVAVQDKTCILLVEDNEDHAYLIANVMESIWDNIVVHHCADATEAIEYMRDCQGNWPDLILLDLKMPGADGFDFLRAIKLHSGWRQIPVVVLTGSTAPEDRTHAYKNHANSYLIKPKDFAGYRHLAGELRRYWQNMNQPSGGRPMRLPSPPRYV